MELDSGRGGGFLEGGYVGNSIRFIDLGVEKDCIIDSLVNGYIRAWSFWYFFTNSNHFSDFCVKYVGSSPITGGITMSRSFSQEFIMSESIFRIGTKPVCSMHLFCCMI